MGGRIRLLVAYRGTHYCGWQLQPNGTTVQEVLEEAFRRMTGMRTRMLAAARTDSGVHAEGQVAVCDNPSRHGPEALREGLNFHLPPDVAVLAADEVAENFDPRRQAVGKHYRYVIWNQRVRPVFASELVYHFKTQLDIAALQRAAAAIEGEHDFSAFRAADDESATPVRRVDRCRWSREGARLVFDVFGRAFLKQMVRNLVGTLVEIGRGRWPTERMAQLLSQRDRRRAGPAAPAKGLCLVKVYLDGEEYKRDAGLPG